MMTAIFGLDGVTTENGPRRELRYELRCELRRDVNEEPILRRLSLYDYRPCP